MSAVAVLIPTLSTRVEIPESMRAEEKAQLIAELGSISTEIAKVQTRDEERGKFAEQRWRAIDARIGKLEKSADATGEHKLEVLQKALDKKTETLDKWKWWALSIFATLGTSAIVGLVVFYLTK